MNLRCKLFRYWLDDAYDDADYVVLLAPLFKNTQNKNGFPLDNSIQIGCWRIELAQSERGRLETDSGGGAAFSDRAGIKLTLHWGSGSVYIQASVLGMGLNILDFMWSERPRASKARSNSLVELIVHLPTFGLPLKTTVPSSKRSSVAGLVHPPLTYMKVRYNALVMAGVQCLSGFQQPLLSKMNLSLVSRLEPTCCNASVLIPLCY